jgi:hypothetical protein
MDMKRTALVCLTALLTLFPIARSAAAQDAWVPNCGPGMVVMQGGKTVNFTNRSRFPETVVVALVSASWDATVKQWSNGKTYTLALTAQPGAPNWLYKMTNNDPYAPGEQGNSNYIINVVSDEYNKFSGSFANAQ